MGSIEDQGSPWFKIVYDPSGRSLVDFETDPDFGLSPTGRFVIDPVINWFDYPLPSYLEDYSDRWQRSRKLAALSLVTATTAGLGATGSAFSALSIDEVDFSWLEQRVLHNLGAKERLWDSLDKADTYAAFYGDAEAFQRLYMQDWEPPIEPPADRTGAQRAADYRSSVSHDILLASQKGEFYDPNLQEVGRLSAHGSRAFEPDTSRPERSWDRPRRY